MTGGESAARSVEKSRPIDLQEFQRRKRRCSSVQELDPEKKTGGRNPMNAWTNCRRRGIHS